MSIDDFEIINDKPRDYWINQDFVPKNLTDNLKNADVLIIPDFRGENNDVGFYEESIHFYEFLQNQNENISMKICMDEESASVFRLQSAEIWLGHFIVKEVAIPLFINILGAYLYNHCFHDSDDIIHIEISNENEKSTKKFKYHGKYDGLHKFIENSDSFTKLFDDENE